MRLTNRFRKVSTIALASVLSLTIGAGSLMASGHQAAGNLPAGTAISVDIDNPASGTTFVVAPGDTADVTVDGNAAVGEGAVVKDTTVVYALDRSGSMGGSAGVDCTGDAVTDNRLTCAKVAVSGANQEAADASSAVGLTGLASYESSATSHVVDLGPGGTALLVSPDHDGNTNGTFDVEEVVNALGLGFQTNYAAGLQASVDILNDPANTSAVNVILFLSDADNASVMVGPHVSTVAIPGNTTIHTFGMGVGPSCDFDGGTGSLDDIAALSTAGTGTCQVVTDMSELADFIAESIGSTLDSLEISVDGGMATTIPNADISQPLPQPGPVTVDYSTTASSLAPGDHEICVTANGTDAGGSDSVTACVTIQVVVGVDIDIKPGSDPNATGLNSQGVIPVAILSTADFDAPAEVDASSLTFGRTGDEPSLQIRGNGTPNCAAEDVNGDGLADLVCHFHAQIAGFEAGDTEGILKGQTNSGDPILGSDSVKVAGS